MKMSGNTILITGGTSGIGFELARQLCDDNIVIITGRDPKKLEHAKGQLSKVVTAQCDVTDPAAITALFERIRNEFPKLNILINNAGVMHKINLHDSATDLDALTSEITTNLQGPIRMTKQFLPLLKQQPTAAIVNVSSGLAYVPLAISPVYSATKAGLHSFTQALRIQMRGTNIRIFELAPPATDTPLLIDGFDDEDLKGIKGMHVTKLVEKTIAGLKADKEEIRPGLSSVLYMLGRIAPQFAANELGKSARRMRDQAK